MATKPRKKPVYPDNPSYVRFVVEVPRAALADIAELSWDELVAMAESAGWRTRTTDDYYWCAKEHALLREGIGSMKGIPVLMFQQT